MNNIKDQFVYNYKLWLVVWNRWVDSATDPQVTNNKIFYYSLFSHHLIRKLLKTNLFDEFMKQLTKEVQAQFVILIQYKFDELIKSLSTEEICR